MIFRRRFQQPDEVSGVLALSHVRQPADDPPRRVPAAGHLEERERRGVIERSDHCDLGHVRERQVDGLEPLREGRRIAGGERRDRRDRALGDRSVAALAGQRGEPEEHERRHRPTGRRRVVLDVLRAGDEALVIDLAEGSDAVVDAVFDALTELQRAGVIVFDE